MQMLIIKNLRGYKVETSAETCSHTQKKQRRGSKSIEMSFVYKKSLTLPLVRKMAEQFSKGKGCFPWDVYFSTGG